MHDSNFNAHRSVILIIFIINKTSIFIQVKSVLELSKLHRSKLQTVNTCLHRNIQNFVNSFNMLIAFIPDDKVQLDIWLIVCAIKYIVLEES